MGEYDMNPRNDFCGKRGRLFLFFVAVFGVAILEYNFFNINSTIFIIIKLIILYFYIENVNL